MNKLTNETNLSQIKPCNYIAIVTINSDGELEILPVKQDGKCTLLRLKDEEVAKMYNMGVTTVLERSNPSHKNYVKDFPKPYKEGRSTYWNLSEVLGYAKVIKLERDSSKAITEACSFNVKSDSANDACFDANSDKIESTALDKVASAIKTVQPVYKNGKRLPMLLKVEEVAKYLSCSVTTVWKLINKNSDAYNSDFPLPVKIHGSTRWLTDEIFDFIERLKFERARVLVNGK